MTQEKIAVERLKLKLINEKDDINPFSCTNEELNKYLHFQAKRSYLKKISATHLVYYNDIVVGFFTLTNDIIKKDNIYESKEELGYNYSTYPAIKIARLATDRNYVRRGVGTHMLYNAVGIAATVSEFSGCRFMTVDIKAEDPHLIEFYEGFGFQRVNNFEATGKERTIPYYLDYIGVYEKNDG